MAYRYFIKLAYNGQAFHGWQVQKGSRTVQGVIEEALSKVLRNEIAVMGCGRTDSGVHASIFYAHFDHSELFPGSELDHLAFKLNKMLGKEIAIYDIFPVGEKAHARFDATHRTYHYRIARKKDPFQADFSWYLFGKLDLGLMNHACEILKEYEDFECFSKVNTNVKTFLCDIYEASWEEKDEMLIFRITANRFLRNMVRAIVGTMLELGQHKIDLQDFRQIIESKNRSEAGFSVPAQGLFLTDVTYPDRVLNFELFG